MMDGGTVHSRNSGALWTSIHLAHSIDPKMIESIVAVFIVSPRERRT